MGGVKHVKFIPITPGLCWTRICKSPLNYHPQGKSSSNVLPSTKKAHSLCECLFTRSIWLSYKSPWAKEARFHNMATTLRRRIWELTNPVSGDVASFGAMLEACDFVSKRSSPAHLCLSCSRPKCKSLRTSVVYPLLGCKSGRFFLHRSWTEWCTLRIW